ncbi:hydrolase 1, exosortase A system-associated [Sphingomonas sp. H39-1-10]|uniref:hydrolase 1, exosortase A system-associated n=1 Tax=Sphingomonas pollutisoli TaxID=3030829 RepID=UPI0023B9B6AD|nr:hydrolase 1, exosortase A system-associated [Sphingomonas pollutisoli]MDF0489462.1 hydrolase 1, exosortase A system-associated [Sphingomonas pollutisoli]
MRRLIDFACAGERLLGTLDAAAGETGLLIVSGGNEVRSGAHRGMALLAARLAAAGVPVFRFDRRGIGDSSGENGGFLSSAPDIAAAAAAFAAQARVRHLVAFGNCDAATALALFGACAGIDRLILANPWVIEDDDGLPPAAAIRARYAEMLKAPRAWLRLARGGVDLRRLAGGLRKLSKAAAPGDEALAARLFGALDHWGARATILLANGDATAIAFRDAAKAVPLAARIETLESTSHSFAREGDADWLFERIMAAL